VGPVLDNQIRSKDAGLQTRLAFVREVIEGPFQEADRRAKIAQNRYRRQRVAIIAASLLATAFAAAESSFNTATWIAVVVTALSAAGAALTSVVRQDEALGDYIRQRRRAEELRSALFVYVCSPGTGQEEAKGRHSLRLKVAAICHQEG
jgi:heme exporter protein D